jgi:hypothetical protein
MGPSILAAAAVALGLVVLASRGLTAAEAEPPGPHAAANELIGVVVYSDPEWGLAFVHDGVRTVLVEPAGHARSPAPGRRVEVRGRPGRVRGLSALTEADLRDTGPAPVPDPEEIQSPDALS